MQKKKISDLEDRTIEMIQSEEKRKNEKESRTFIGIMGHNERKQYLLYGNFRRKGQKMYLKQ